MMNKNQSSDSCSLARAWLSRIKRQKEEVESRTFRLQVVQSMASRVTSALSQAPVSHSCNPSVMDDSVARIMEAEGELADAFADLLDITKEVSDLLRCIQDSDCRRVMELHYVSLSPLSEIAYDMKCSRRWVTELHTKGLRIVQRLLEGKKAA